jgi:dTDP-4-dehydrorhamnose 3,5-epimerase
VSGAARGPIDPIDGVATFPLRRIPDERGAVFHMLRADAPHFQGFGEVYFSAVYSGAVKAWRRHRKMTLQLAVPVGMVKLVLYDDRPGSPTHGHLMEMFVGELDYRLILVPPGIWYGFRGLGTGTALVANCASLPHDDAEVDRADLVGPAAEAVPYVWGP